MTEQSDPTRLRTVAVVLAGGTGTRIGSDLPKQLLQVAGRTILEHTVQALHDCQEVDELVVVMTADLVEDARALLTAESFPKLSRVLAGGRDRSASTRVALAALGEQECNVLLHDAVRPLVSGRVVRACVEALATHEAVEVAVASADTIVRVDETGRVMEIPDRSRLRRGQTPQGFRLSTIRRAYGRAATDHGFSATDDCAVVLRYLPEVRIQVVPGDEENMKVTYPVDLFLVDALLSSASAEKHLSAPTRAVPLGEPCARS
jgi:ribitol-5-phosphate 2-dehydrogenase (NADP+) / D-ribitol-5-phosphate cytidylyltransferase